MRVDPLPSEVLSLVVGMFEKFLARPQSVFDIEETIRIDGRKQIARTYRVEGFMAMWLLDVGIVQFYDDDGNMLATVNVIKRASPQRMAA